DALSEAIALHRGEVAYNIERGNKLTEPYESWLRPFRDEYRRRLIDTHASLAELLRAPDPEQALDVLDRAVRIEPWNERLYEVLIGIHLDLGQRHSAERRFGELSDLLASLGTSPGSQVVRMMRTSRQECGA